MTGSPFDVVAFDLDGTLADTAPVADSITDADTAKAAGMPFVAVSFGYSDRPVEAVAADAVIDRYDRLIDVLERL